MRKLRNRRAKTFATRAMVLLAATALIALPAATQETTINAAVDSAAEFWGLGGNNGTMPGTDFLGTTDNVALELHIDGRRAFLLEPMSISPNLIGGLHYNAAEVGVYGATIGGGGSGTWPNLIFDHFSTVAGGLDNVAGSDDGLLDNATFATVGGGRDNIASEYATVPGGDGNTAAGRYASPPARRLERSTKALSCGAPRLRRCSNQRDHTSF